MIKHPNGCLGCQQPGTDGDCLAKCVWIFKINLRCGFCWGVKSTSKTDNSSTASGVFLWETFVGCALWGELNNPILGLYATQKWPHMPTIVKSDPWYRLPWIKARTWYGSFFHRLPPMHGFHQWPIYVPWPQSPPLFQSIYRVQGWNCIHSKVKVMCSQDPQPTLGSTFMSVGEPD